ncbi:MAG: serine hydrolase [Gemmatimonas sp.]|nr:serine hydrolase [Gemmatimonas sp.]
MRLATLRSVASILLAAAPAAAQTPDRCAGHWTGAIELPTAKLAFELDFTRQADRSCAGRIAIPQQGMTNGTLKDVMVTADSVRFTIADVPGAPTFRGTFTADGRSAKGAFTQGGSLLAFAMTAGPSPAEAARAALAGFDAFIDSARTAWKVVGLSVGIVVNGETVYLKGHGLRNLEKNLPATPQTLFAIGSSSKAFTTFAMGALVDQGRLQWDAPVRTYLPWFRMRDDAVTLRITPRDLVTHRSGLPRHDLLWYNNATMSREELVRRIAWLPLNKDLRETYQYNNLMFLTAGYLVGSINGTSWETGLRQLVLDPLGMKRTNFSVTQSAADPDHSLGYRVRRDSIQGMPFRDISLVGPAGAINSSAEEMLKWVGLHLANGKLGDKQVIQSATLRDMYRPYTPIAGLGQDAELGPTSYGLGWVVDTYRGRYRAQHGGNIDGFSALVTLLPRDNIGIVVLANQNGAAITELIARHAMDRLFGGARRDWNAEALARSRVAQQSAVQAEQRKGEARVPNAPPAHPLTAYAGVYADSGYGPMTFALERDTLIVTYNGIRAKLQPWHYETFSGLRNPDDPTFENLQFTFRTSAVGRVDAALVTMDANVPAVVFLRQPDPQLKDPAYLARFVGRYQGPGVVTSVSVRGNVLLWTQGAGAPVELEPEHGARFVIKANRSITLEFKTDAAGKVTGVRSMQPGAVLDWPRLP